MVASGTFGYGFDAPQVDRAALGAIVSKGTTLRPREGNAPTRIAETPSGILNSIGLENPGAAAVAKKYAKAWRALGVPVIVNVAGYSVDLKYDPERLTFLGKRIGDSLVFGGDTNKIVAMTETNVTVQATSTTKRTTVAYAPAP